MITQLIQGLGAGMGKLAAILIYNYRWDNNEQNIWWTNMLVHDEFNHICIENLAKDKAKVIEEMMIKAGTYFCKTVPMEAESKIADYWYH